MDAILAVYEFNRLELLRDMYVWAYERSCPRYSAVRQSLGEPDPFRLRYREAIDMTVAEVVRNRIDKTAANTHIEKQATEELPQSDQARFNKVAATELTTLHEGNNARYRLRPSEYRDWHDKWVRVPACCSVAIAWLSSRKSKSWPPCTRRVPASRPAPANTARSLQAP